MSSGATASSNCATSPCCSAASGAGCGRAVPPVRAVGGVSLDGAAGRDPRPRRRIRLRQDHARPHRAGAAARDRGRNPARRRDRQRLAAESRRAAGATTSSMCIRTPPPRSTRGGASAARSKRGCDIHGVASAAERARAGRRDPRSRRARSLHPAALSARIVGRPAAPRRARPHPGVAAALCDPRRADLRSRHVGAGDGAESAARIARALRADLSVHLARSVGGEAVLRPGRDHVSRPYRRTGRRPPRFSPRRAIPIRGRCWRRCRGSTRRRREPRPPLPGEPPSAARLPPGCVFSSRCPHVEPACREREPALCRNDGPATTCSMLALARYPARRRYRSISNAGAVGWISSLPERLAL